MMLFSTNNYGMHRKWMKMIGTQITWTFSKHGRQNVQTQPERNSSTAIPSIAEMAMTANTLVHSFQFEMLTLTLGSWRMLDDVDLKPTSYNIRLSWNLTTTSSWIVFFFKNVLDLNLSTILAPKMYQNVWFQRCQGRLPSHPSHCSSQMGIDALLGPNLGSFFSVETKAGVFAPNKKAVQNQLQSKQMNIWLIFYQILILCSKMTILMGRAMVMQLPVGYPKSVVQMATAVATTQ